MEIKVKLNGKFVSGNIAPDMLLIDFLRDHGCYSVKRGCETSNCGLCMPSSMQPVMVARWGIDPATKANQITREQKRELVQLIKHWRVSIDARGDLAHAVITSGGVSVREVDPKTMQSKKALGLYFAGEVLDVDAYTGGYNLQIAFCTAQAFANNL